MSVEIKGWRTFYKESDSTYFRLHRLQVCSVYHISSALLGQQSMAVSQKNFICRHRWQPDLAYRLQFANPKFT